MSTATETDTERDLTGPDAGLRNGGGSQGFSGNNSWGTGRGGNSNLMGLVPKLWEKGFTPTGTPKMTPRSRSHSVTGNPDAEKDSSRGYSQERSKSSTLELQVILCVWPAAPSRHACRCNACLGLSVHDPKLQASGQEAYRIAQQQRRAGGALTRASPSFVAYIDKSDSDTPASQPKCIVDFPLRMGGQGLVPAGGGGARRGPLSGAYSVAPPPAAYPFSASPPSAAYSSPVAPSPAAAYPASRQPLSEFSLDSENEEALMSRLSDARMLSGAGSMISSPSGLSSLRACPLCKSLSIVKLRAFRSASTIF